MAYDPGALNASLAAAVGSDSELMAELRAAFIESAARQLDIPVLLIRGGLSDVLSESGAREFLELVPHAEYADVMDAAHMIASDSNERFSAAILPFLRRLAG